MSVTKHTPGPWQTTRDNGIRIDDRVYRIVWGAGATGRDVAYCTAGDDVGNANARLIAAAPDLLGACERIVAVFTATSRPDPDAIADAIRACLAAVEKVKAGVP